MLFGQPNAEPGAWLLAELCVVLGSAGWGGKSFSLRGPTSVRKRIQVSKFQFPGAGIQASARPRRGLEPDSSAGVPEQAGQGR